MNDKITRYLYKFSGGSFPLVYGQLCQVKSCLDSNSNTEIGEVGSRQKVSSVSTSILIPLRSNAPIFPTSYG